MREAKARAASWRG